jgi:quaternary ammonium compound-resistance protein SugE
LAWILVLIAGLMETGWVVGLKYSDGFTKLVPSVLTVIALGASMLLLSIAARTLPIGTAYGVWVGIGAAGAAIIGVWMFDEPATPARIFFLTLLLVAIVGLKMTATS